ncbi:hypothetical protein NIASO_09995 [Niabella soli DSM 19437]|uniref:Uncharacterized protein n=1 Tax=Niabella soli DSM 19437 TaxID=929713 RepID=W0F3E6_9BACT|nr:hypothetical protein NIASO_09995 [Niabella soli DSM 19437]
MSSGNRFGFCVGSNLVRRRPLVFPGADASGVKLNKKETGIEH